MVTFFVAVLPLESVTVAVNVTSPDSFKTPDVPSDDEEMTAPPLVYLIEQELMVELYAPAPVAFKLH